MHLLHLSWRQPWDCVDELLEELLWAAGRKWTCHRKSKPEVKAEVDEIDEAVEEAKKKRK